MKVFLSPRASQAANDNGIGRIIHAQEKYMPALGFTFTSDPDSADICVYHAGTASPNDKDISVLSVHGLYWSDLTHHEFSRSNNVANQRIIDAARRAKVITVPSDWVAEPFRRDMRIEPTIIGHGIDIEEWSVGEPQGYILWNKNRPTDVCDPSPAWRLAEKELKVVSTFGPVGKMIPQLRVTGQLPFDRMKPIIESAEIYLATTPETFGIGTLEAMVCFPADTNVEAKGIVRTMERLYTGRLFTIKTSEKTIRVTEDHPFWTNEGWVPVKSLTNKHLLCYTGSYGRTEKIYSGTIGSIVNSLRNDVSKRGWLDNGDFSGCSISVDTRYGGASKEIQIHQSNEASVVDTGTIGLCGRIDRWRGNYNDQKKREENKADGYYLQHQSRPDGMVDKCVAGAGGLLRTQQQKKWIGRLLFPDFRNVIYAPLESSSPLSGDKKETNGINHRMVKYSSRTEQRRRLYASPSRDCFGDQGFEYQSIQEISSEEVIDLPVYNLTTETNTYLAEGYLVHNCGVPILGYDWCGTHDLVRHKETGWLVSPGDIAGLYEGALWLKEHRKEISANARQFALGFGWPSIMRQYAEVFERAARPEPAGVSIVITNYNYGRYLPDAIKSCLWQQTPPNEIIVVDDGSTDNSLEVVKQFEGKVSLIKQTNQGVAAARNNGIAAALFPLVVCLDADDMLGPDFIAALRPALERDRGMGVAYTGLRFIDADGHDTGFSAYRPFSWELQAKGGVPPTTCIPSGSIFRKSMWERAGGYRQKYAPGEDTEFWVRGLSVGFTAEMVTPETHFWYRGHEGSASRTGKYVAIDDNKPWMRDRVYPMAAPAYYVPEVRSYLNPVVSVIIPVGPGHEKLVEDAIESVVGQTIREWELILIDDTGSGIVNPMKDKYPFIKMLYTSKGKEGAGKARNIGIEEAKGQFVVFLDADDWLRNDALDLMLQLHVKTGMYVFTDHVEVHEDGKQVNRSIMPYDRQVYQRDLVMHSVTALIPTEWAKRVGGFDPSLIGWEEYDFYMKLAVAGLCGALLRQPVLYYRIDTGKRRQVSQKNSDKLNAEFRRRYEGVEMSPCCGGGGSAILDAKRALGLLPRETVTIVDLPNEVRLEFTGTWTGPVAFQANGRTYYGAQDDLHRFINAPKEDVEKLVSTQKWRVILPPAEARMQPPPLTVAEDENRAVMQAGQPNPAGLIRVRKD